MDPNTAHIISDMINEAVIDLREEFNEKIKKLHAALEKAIEEIKALTSDN